ncbi:MAG TPA: efflux RND transporter permease subunit, partial [Candidatus Ozemobacteraceae bacterium]
MSFISTVLRRPVWVGVLWMLVTLLGVRAYFVLPQDLFPDTVPPQIVVMTVIRGAGAADVNRQVSTLLDRELKGLTGVVKVTATSRDEISSVNVQFEYGTDLGLATNDVVNAVARLKSQFPTGTQEPQIFRVTDANRPVMTLGVRPRPGSGLDLRAVRLLAENDLKEELLMLPGVGKIDIFGAHSPEVLVRLDIDRLQQFRLDPEAVLTAIGADNLTLPGGYWLNRGRESLVKTVQEARTPEELAAIPLRVAEGGVVSVGDVASISLGFREPRSLYHGNGSAAIALNILKTEGGNAMQALASVKGHLPRLEEMFPGLAFDVTTDQQPIIDINLAGMRDSLFSAIWLTMLVVLVFLVEIRTSLIIGISIPLSFLTALAFLGFTSYTLNMVTLTGLIVAVGMVVDASVVVVENVFRRFEGGERTPEVVAAGTEEVVFSILGGMLTTVVVMIPIMFAGGYAQQVLRPLTLMITATLIGSFVAAITIVPHLLRWMFFRNGTMPAGAEKPQEPAGSGAVGFQHRMLEAIEFGLAQMAEGYLWLLRGVLRFRLTALVVCLVLLAVSARLTLPLIGRELMPPMDAGMVTINLNMPPAMPLDEVEALVTRCEEVVNRSPHVQSVSTVVGAEPGQVSFGAGGQLPQQAEMQIRLSTRDRRDQTVWEIMNEWRRSLAAIPGLESVSVKEYGATPLSTTRAPIDVVVAGRDPVRLAEIGNRIVREMGRIPGLRDPLLNWRYDKPETLFHPSLELLAKDRLSVRAIGEFLGVTLTGRYPSRMQMDGYLDLPVRAEIGRAGKPWRADLSEMPLPQPKGELFLSGLGRLEPVLAPTLLTRENLRQTIDIMGINDGRPLSAVAADVEEAIGRIELPGGYTA